MKYRKKPVEIEAVTFEEFQELIVDSGVLIPGTTTLKFSYMGHDIVRGDNGQFLIPTEEGTMAFTDKDMLIIGVLGEIYPCKIEIFKMTYDAV